jgi:transcriptional regulator with XRE-family HTH domain
MGEGEEDVRIVPQGPVELLRQRVAAATCCIHARAATACQARLRRAQFRGLCQWYSKNILQPFDQRGVSVKFFDRVLNPREIRRRLGMNQEQFWTQIGVTQSGGSRYESGREMPRPVKELLRLVHVEQIDLSQVKRVDFEIISYLKEAHPDLYRNLRRAARTRSGGQDISAFSDVVIPAATDDFPATGAPQSPSGDARHD